RQRLPGLYRPPTRAGDRCPCARVASARPAQRRRAPARRSGLVSGATLERRLANYRATLAAGGGEPGDRRDGGVGRGSIDLGRRLAEAVDGELVLDPGG